LQIISEIDNRRVETTMRVLTALIEASTAPKMPE